MNEVTPEDNNISYFFILRIGTYAPVMVVCLSIMLVKVVKSTWNFAHAKITRQFERLAKYVQK